MKLFDSNGKFSIAPQGDGHLRQLAVKGAGATLFSSGVGLAIQVASTVVLARLLTPADFGLVTMVTTFSLLLVNFGFNGMTEAIVQREEMDEDLASTLFWINLVGGIVLTAAFAAAGSLLARFYHDALVQQVAVGISFTILATSVSTVHLALLKRAMHFSALSVNDIVGRLISVATAIALGWAGWGYWALVGGAIILPVSTSVGAFILCPWLPRSPKDTAGLGSTLKFAMNTYGNFAVNYLSRNTDNLLVGWRFDAQSLGFYKKAYDLFALSAGQLVSSMTVVVVGTLSRVRKDMAQYQRYLVATLGVMAFVGMGLSAGLTLVGKDIIRVLLGPRWIPAGQIFTYFGPGVGAMILYGAHGWIHLSIGRADRWLRWGIFEFGVTVVLFLIGLPYGPAGIAVAWTVSFWLLTLPAIWYAGRPISLPMGSVISAVWRYFMAALLAGGGTELILRQFPMLNAVEGIAGAVYRIGVGSLVLVLLYLGAVVLLHGGFAPLNRIRSLLLEMLPARRPSNEPLAVIPEPALAAEVSATPLFAEPVTSEAVPMVSILIPAYNAEQWIEATIRSALAQTWPRKEIIVVDDGSKDRTVEVAKRFESQGVRVVGQKNQGASAARNKAFSLSSGDYIQWLDADDLLAPDKIGRQMELVMQGVSKRRLLSCPWGHFMFRPQTAEFIPSALWCDLSPVEWLLRKMGQNVYMQTATWLVSRELTEAAGPWDVRMLGDDDGEYFCRVLLASDGVKFVPEAKVFYRAFQFNSLSYVGRFPKKIEAHWLSMQLHIQYLRSLEESERVHAACLQFMRDSLIYFYPESAEIVQEMEQVSAEFGEPLGVPGLSWKYLWIEKLFGWHFTKQAQRAARKCRWSLKRSYDALLMRAQNLEGPVSKRQPPHPAIAESSDPLTVAGNPPA
jgi:O-antigen/teichoic acid export membrane protein/glycosyltransferase involved in cell wall biosynthesis